MGNNQVDQAYSHWNMYNSPDEVWIAGFILVTSDGNRHIDWFCFTGSLVEIKKECRNYSREHEKPLKIILRIDQFQDFKKLKISAVSLPDFKIENFNKKIDLSELKPCSRKERLKSKKEVVQN
jgi:hypothetical protein